MKTIIFKVCLFFAALPPAPANPLVEEGAGVEILAEGFKFTEGPAVAPGGDLYFTDIRQSIVHRWDVAKAEVSTVLENSGGMNGLQFDKGGRLLACQGGERRVVAVDPAKGEVVEILADKFEGKRFNNPNDLWIDPKGGVYFTDPAYSRKKDELELDGRHVFYVTPDEKKIVKVADDFNTPNGIVGSPDGKTLFITDRRLGRTYRYRIAEDGTLLDKMLFCKVGADGMTLDERGNLYTTPQKQELRVFAPDGTELPPIPLPFAASNVCFAGTDGKTLFITTSSGKLASLRMNVGGH